MIYTTLNKIASAEGTNFPRHEYPPKGLQKLLYGLGKTHLDDEELPFFAIVTSNGVEYALWCMRTINEPDLCRRILDRFEKELMSESRAKSQAASRASSIRHLPLPIPDWHAAWDLHLDAADVVVYAINDAVKDKKTESSRQKAELTAKNEILARQSGIFLETLWASNALIR